MIYLAGPIDFVGKGGPTAVWRAMAMKALERAGLEVFDPSTAHAHHDQFPAAPAVWLANQQALGESDGVLALLPPGVVTIGTPMEIEHARMIGVPVVVVGGAESLQLEGAGVPQYHLDDVEQAVAHLIGMIDIEPALNPDDPAWGVVRWVGDGLEPRRKYQGDAGFDLFVSEDRLIPPGETRDVPHGVSIELPPMVWGMITGRSSTIRVRNLLVSQGIIDNEYRGPLFSAVTNMGREMARIREGERLSQFIPMPLMAADLRFERVLALSESERGVAGFGSTGA